MSTFRVSLITIAIIILTMGALRYQGRLWFGPSGYPALWNTETQSQQNSQRLFDPYSFTHVIHGLLFYLLAWGLSKYITLNHAKRFLLAVSIESLWEVLENTATVIERYRTATLSLDYYGDSILNSVGDIIASMVGYALAMTLPVYGSFVLFIGLEVLLAYWIRDNLTLNILLLIYPIQSIKDWQLRN